MKTWLIAALLVLSASAVQAQSTLSSGTCDTSKPSTGCVVVDVRNLGTMTWTTAGQTAGTLVFEATADAYTSRVLTNTATWVSLYALANGTLTPLVTSTTSDGTWTAPVAGFTAARIRFSSFVSGVARVSVGTALSKSLLLPLPLSVTNGGTGGSLAATVGTSQFLKQASVGAAVTVVRPTCSDLSNAATGCSTATGTSGATIPILNVANTWGATQTFPNITLGSLTGIIRADSGVMSVDAASSNEVVGVGAGYKIARGVTALDGANPTPIATGLTTITSCTMSVVRTTALTSGTAEVTPGAISGGSIDAYGWVLAGTASSGTENVNWICAGS